jgi:hypothetical protein
MYSILKYPVKLSILVYIFITLIILYNKPDILFDDEGRTKGFGCSKNCEFFNFPVILYASAILITFLFEAISIHNE